MQTDSQVKGGEKSTEDREFVTVSEQTDRVYISTPDEHTLTNVAGNRTIVLKKCGLPDTGKLHKIF